MFEITEKVEGNGFLGEKWPPGVYENGLLTITTKDDAIRLSESLEWPIYHKYRVVAYNCMGDLFIQKPDSKEIGYLWLQYGYGRYIAKDQALFFKMIETEGEDQTKFLETFALDYLLKNKSALPYGSVFTMAPILALGGDSTLEGLNRCGVGHLNVYLSIVSQSYVPEHYGEFA